MPDKLVFLPEARQDIAEAYSWYEGQDPGLGMDFLRCLEVAILSIERHPRIYPIVHEDYRRALVRRFPYAIFFKHDAEQIKDGDDWFLKTIMPSRKATKKYLEET